MYSWGEVDCADLGLTPLKGKRSYSLRYQKDSIHEVSFQNHKPVVVLKNGKALIFEEKESLTHQQDRGWKKPKCVRLEDQKIQTAIGGESHVLFLSRAGRTYEYTYLEKNNSRSPKTVIPRSIQSLQNTRIIQVACGKHHSLALSQGGQLFAWGLNTFGQLGLGRERKSEHSPQHLTGLDGIPLAQIAAGGEHSIAVSLSGTVLTWGRNNAGQLGLGSCEDMYIPNTVKALEHKKSIFVSCGEEHTAVLTKGGLMFTFGAGGYGQLGHNSTRNEPKPRLVAELLGVRVSQIACGRSHTLAFVSTTGKLYSFGCGEQGQLGNKKSCNQLVPICVQLPPGTKNSAGPKHERRTPGSIKQITAGGNQSIAVCFEEETIGLFGDQYAFSTDNGIATLDDALIDRWINTTDSKRKKKIKREISLMFSSAACVNGSFLEKSNDEHFKTSMVTSGVDMSAVYLFFEKIMKRPQVLEQVKAAVKKLLESLSDSPVGPEALRVYLIIPELIRLLDEEYDVRLLISLLSKAILKLKKDKLQILESLWSALPTPFFKMLVSLYQRESKQYFLKTMEDCNSKNTEQLHVTLAVLQKLCQVNAGAGFKIEETNFYLPEIETWYDIFECLCLHINTIIEGGKGLNFLLSLAQYPCIFDLEIKLRIFQLECDRTVLPEVISGLCNKLEIRRQHLFEDTSRYLRAQKPATFHIPLQVLFVGEEGIDEGGVSQEFFTIITKELCAPESGIFKHYEESRLVWFPEDTEEPKREDIFYLAGVLCGLALYNKCVADFHFPLVLYKKLMNIKPTLGDLHELSPTEARCLQDLLDEECEDAIEDLMLDFTISPSDRSTPVTKHNRKQYVNAYVDYMLNSSVKKHFDEFARGFKTGCQTSMLNLFLPAELLAIIHGNTEYDWEQLEKNVKYAGYDASDETIKNFWAVFHELSEDMKKKFLTFLTGSDRVPFGGMEKFAFTVRGRRHENPDLYYPSANTCSRILDLPRYSNMEILRDQLLHALKFYEEFGLV